MPKSIQILSIAIITCHHWLSPINADNTDNTDYHWHHQSNTNLHSGTTLTVYSNSHTRDTMTCSTLTSFHASRQPSRKSSKPIMSARLSPVSEPSPSQVPECIINCDEAIDLMPPGCQQSSPRTFEDCDNDGTDSGECRAHNLLEFKMQIGWKAEPTTFYSRCS